MNNFFSLYTIKWFQVKLLPRQFQQVIHHSPSEIADNLDQVHLDQFVVTTAIKK